MRKHIVVAKLNWAKLIHTYLFRVPLEIARPPTHPCWFDITDVWSTLFAQLLVLCRSVCRMNEEGLRVQADKMRSSEQSLSALTPGGPLTAEVRPYYLRAIRMHGNATTSDWHPPSAPPNWCLRCSAVPCHMPYHWITGSHRKRHRPSKMNFSRHKLLACS